MGDDISTGGAPGAAASVRHLGILVVYFLKERGVSFIGNDGINDVSPTGFPPAMGLPVHQIALASMGIDIFDNLDFERAIETARRLNRYEFMFSAAPLRIEKGMGSPLNPLAIF